MIDDGEWAGIPIGGLGTGSIGRTFRGDFARWHLDVGHHRFEPVAADGFSLFVGRADGSRQATVLAVRPPGDGLETWGWDLPVGGGTYHALFPRAWQTFDADVVGVGVIGEQLSPVIAGDLERSALPVGVFEWWIENPGPEPVTVGIMATFADPPGGPDHGAPVGRAHAVRRRRIRPGRGIRRSRARSARSVARHARACRARRWLGDRPARRSSIRVADVELWSDFATDGRLTRATPARADSPTAGPAGAAIAATTVRWRPASGRPSGSRSPGTCRWWSSAAVDAGGSDTPATGDAQATVPGTSRSTRCTRRLRGAPRSIAGSARSSTTRNAAGLVPRRAVQRAVLPRRRWHVLGGGRGRRSPPRSRMTPGGSPSSNASTTRSTTPSTSTSTLHSRCSSCSRSWSCAGSATFWRPSPSTTRRPSHPGIGPRGTAQGRRAPCRTMSVARMTTRTTGPTGIGSRMSTAGRTSARSSSCRRGATRSPPGPAGDALIREVYPAVDAVLGRLALADRDGDGLPEHDGEPDQTYDTWPMRGPSRLRRLAVARRYRGRRGDGASARGWRG